VKRFIYEISQVLNLCFTFYVYPHRHNAYERMVLEFKHVYLNGCSLNISCLNIVMDILTSHLLEVETLHLKSNSLSKDTGMHVTVLKVGSR
jgi:hypothetical protein